MPISPIGATGLGLSVAGGIANASGQNRRGSAMTRAAGNDVGLTQEVAAENAASRRFFDPQYGALPQENQQSLDDFIRAMGPERTQRLGQMQGEAGQIQTAASERMRDLTPAALPFQNTGAGMTTALNARRRQMAMAAPGQQARQLQLAHGMLAPVDAQAGSQRMDTQAGLDRRFGELQQSEGLRRALAASRFGLQEQNNLDQMQQAQSTGMGLGALGQFVGNIGQGMTHHVAFPRVEAPSSYPSYAERTSALLSAGMDPREELALIRG
jgi:hypothetical protein